MSEKINKTPQTFKDFGLEFTPNKECITCNSGSCHNNVSSKIDGKEYNVHITIDYDEKAYYVYATENSSTLSPNDVFERFKKEEDAVKYICDRFDWFKCF